MLRCHFENLTKGKCEALLNVSHSKFNTSDLFLSRRRGTLLKKCFEYSRDHLMILGFFAFPETCQSSLGGKGVRSRSRNKIMIFGIIFIFLLCGWLYNYQGLVVDGLTDNKSSASSDYSTCKSKRHVVYIKTHKTGSSTITNIMYR